MPSTPTPTRRSFLKTTASAAAISVGAQAAASAAAPEAKRQAQLIKTENAKPGAADWQLTRVNPNAGSGFRTTLIEGYCSKQSVAAGDSIDIMVSSDPATDFTIEIFRTGYYGGAGARLMKKLGPFKGKTQPTPEPERGERQLYECQWEPAVSLEIPDDWPSGVYLGRLTTTTDKTGFGYWQSFVVFIVKDDRPADIVIQCSDNTWQAYNKWPSNYSVYTHKKGNQGPWASVSFDRPYAKYAQIYDNPQSIGSGEWLCFEFPFAHWLEEQGYDVTYCSNSDMIDSNYARPGRFKAFASVGHDEYWDIRQYENAVKLRDSGTSLLFFSGNSVCWVTPMTPSEHGERPNRIMFRGGPYGGDYKYATDREKSEGPFPHRGPDEGYLMGARNVDPVNEIGRAHV